MQTVELVEVLAPLDDLQLPVDFRRRPDTTSRLESHSFDLTVPEVSGEIAGASITPDLLLTTVFGILLARWTDRTSLSLSASRWPDTQRSARTLSISLETPPDTTCRELLSRVARSATTRDTDAPPSSKVRRVGFTWLEAEPARNDLGAVELVAGPDSSGDGAELHLVAVKCEKGFRAAFVYDSSLFRATSMERFAGHLQTLLTGAVAALDAPISQLPLLAPDERRWLEETCTGPASRAPAPWPELVHQQIEHFADTTPDAIALRHRDRRLTYGELNRRANRLAWYLVAKGVTAESAVVVCVEPSFDIVVALLAILKTGAIYVPVDPNYPAARIQAITDDTRPKLVITQAHLVGRHSLDRVAPVLLDVAEAAFGDELDEANLELPIDPGQTAYVYYTSGTTGKPKGVMASYANLTSYVRMARERYAFGREDIVPAIARFSFSISMWELATPLAAGGTLVILDREHILDPARMARTLSEVTLFHAGPSLLKNLLPFIRENYSDFGCFSRVRHASSGGDMIPPRILDALNEVFSNAEVFVIYGCSEISCMGCTYPVPRGGPVDKTFVGRPFDDVRVRVMDRALNLLPAGMVGQVHFSGSGLVKGYLNRPDLTAEKFVTIDGHRYYRTGDLGRLSESGWLELVGRDDFQVKVRGMRVELAEVEHHLRGAPGVRDAVVAAREAANGEKILVAYVVMEAGNEADRGARKSSLRRHMVDQLPDYMVPAVYVELASLPLNANMKVDRLALPALDLTGGQPHDERQPEKEQETEGETESERVLAWLWRKHLGVEQVSVDANFFELGGDSLVASGLLLDVQRELGVTLDGMELLRESLSVLAGICDARLGRTDRSPRASTRDLHPGPSDVVQPFHFGPDNTLYGVLRGRLTTRDAVLICPPLGHELFRASFVLGQLARQLAGRDIPTLQFDYYGTGDSLGESHEATRERWEADLRMACTELRRRSGATRITAVGVRLGGALLWNAVPFLDLERIVLWDPVYEGYDHIAELRASHWRYLRAGHDWRQLLPRRSRGTKELLGLEYSEKMLAQLESLQIASLGGCRKVPLKWLATSSPRGQQKRYRRLCGGYLGARIQTLDVDCAWSDVAELETILPDVGIASALATLATEAQ